jgi:hypothetical protein
MKIKLKLNKLVRDRKTGNEIISYDVLTEGERAYAGSEPIYLHAGKLTFKRRNFKYHFVSFRLNSDKDKWEENMAEAAGKALAIFSEAAEKLGADHRIAGEVDLW